VATYSQHASGIFFHCPRHSLIESSVQIQQLFISPGASAERRAGCVAYATAHTNCLTHPAAGGAPTLLTPATKISSSLHGQRRRSPASRRTLPSVHKVDVFWPTYRLRQSHSSAAGVASRRVDNIIVYETNALRCVRRIPTSKLASDNVVRKDVQNCSVIILFDATEIYDDIAVCNEVAECI